LADFRDHFDAIRAAGFDVAAVSVDPPRSAALLQAELYIPFDLLCDTDRSVIRAWDLLNEHERGGIPVAATVAVGHGRRVLARSLDTMTRQVSPQAFLAALESADHGSPPRRFVRPRLFEFLRLNWRARHAAGE
jgi:peroxiredoxin